MKLLSSLGIIILLMVTNPVLAESEILTICENKSIPSGYVVVQRAIPANDCGNWRSGTNTWKPYTRMKIMKLGANQLTVCDGSPQSKIPPDNYKVVKRGVTGVNCGNWRSGTNTWKPYTGITIKKISN